jgi:hypothetical protein
MVLPGFTPPVVKAIEPETTDTDGRCKLHDNLPKYTQCIEIIVEVLVSHWFVSNLADYPAATFRASDVTVFTDLE